MTHHHHCILSLWIASEQPALWSFCPFYSFLTKQVCVNVYSVHGMPWRLLWLCDLSLCERCAFLCFIGMLKLASCFTTGHPYDVTILCGCAKTWHQSLSNGFSNFSVCQFTYGTCFVEHMGVCFVLSLIFDTVMVPRWCPALSSLSACVYHSQQYTTYM
jgi:hypothetical protein